MRNVAIAGMTLFALVGIPAAAPAGGNANWSVGVRVGTPPPSYYYRPYWHYPPYAVYRPYPVYVQPAPVYVESPAVIVRPPLLVQPVYQPAPPPVSTVVRTVGQDQDDLEINRNLQQLADPDERARAESAVKLGRLKAQRAIDPLAATLAGDRSPTVREAAARGLALIGSPKALPALQQAALADSDANVRHTARFAVEIVQASR